MDERMLKAMVAAGAAARPARIVTLRSDSDPGVYWEAASPAGQSPPMGNGFWSVLNVK